MEKCKHCGTPFKKIKWNQVNCSKICQWKEIHRRKRKKRNEARRKNHQKHKGESEYKKRATERSLAYYYRNKWKELARGKVIKAVLSGKLIRPTQCSNCEKQCKPEGHHNDYNKPLEVIWLCKQCHENIHHP